MSASRRMVETRPLDMELLISALIAFPDDGRVQSFMAERGVEMSVQKVGVYRRRGENPDSPLHSRFVERRRELAPELEKTLADDMLDLARLSTVAERLAVEETMRVLEAGEAKEPWRVARDLKQVSSQSVEKRLALEGRPEKVVETRSFEELERTLVAMGVLKESEPPPVIESTAEEDED